MYVFVPLFLCRITQIAKTVVELQSTLEWRAYTSKIHVIFLYIVNKLYLYSCLVVAVNLGENTILLFSG